MNPLDSFSDPVSRHGLLSFKGIREGLGCGKEDREVAGSGPGLLHHWEPQAVRDGIKRKDLLLP